MREPNEVRLRVNGLELQVYEWPGEGQPIFLAHATGFHARCWDQVVAHLPGRHVFAIDMRGHGRSDKPEPPYQWPDFGHDVAATARALGTEGAVGVGHSKGGFAVVHAAALEPGIFASLLLVDPVIMRREMYDARPGGGEHFAARRRNQWASPEEMFESFRARPPFADWEEQVLRDYCTYGLLPNPEGEGYVLACPPNIEAAVYTGSVGGAVIYDSVAALDIPVRVLRARSRTEDAPLDMSSSPTAPDLATHFKHGEDVHLPEYSHFIPMEAPGFVARHIEELLAGGSLAE
ncbi:MAG: alpha/beta hydrolase [Dehalococcoidia bacterium]|nr:alpha/beta hydrolase [Dehalococcoidia bacterium]